MNMNGTYSKQDGATIASENNLNTDVFVFLEKYLNGFGIFRTMVICSRYGLFEPLRVNHDAMSGSKW